MKKQKETYEVNMDFTGERFLPDLSFPEISYEHWHRYLYATHFAKDKVVLDIACGEGYGSSLIAQHAKHVVGVDIDPQAINHASSKYLQKNLEFKVGSLESIPVHESKFFDGIVSFESIEHIGKEQQDAFMREVKRLLKPDGFLLVSTPNKLAYSDIPGYRNEFHLREFYVQELRSFLKEYFQHVKFLGQMIYPVSYLWSTDEETSDSLEFKIELSSTGFRPAWDEKLPLYIVALCSDKKLENVPGSIEIDLSRQMFVTRDRQISSQQSQIAEQEQSLSRLSNQLNEADQKAVTLSAQLNEADQKAAALSAQLKDREKSVQTLQEIQSSRAWKLIQLLWKIRLSIAPPGSRRAKIFGRSARMMLNPGRKTGGVNLERIVDSTAKLPLQRGLAGFDQMKETVLVVSHEASRTGAPVLSLNLVQNLQKKYNVVSLLLGEGVLVKNFEEQSSILAGPVLSRYDPGLADGFIDHITKAYRIKFAIVNSIEARIVIPPLSRRFIPVINLIHEFASYTRPHYAFLEAALWSEEMIFSARVTYENAVQEHPQLSGRSLHILPQGRCVLPQEGDAATSLEQEKVKVTSALRPEHSPDDLVVILGAGTVQMRKGVDLFIDCAAKILRSNPSKDFRFVWIGDGYNPAHDMNYSVYLADQIQRAGLQDHVFFMKNTSNIEAAYQTADLLLLSSRLDPLPNVAIDIMLHGKPLICFEDTTGIADILTERGFADHCVASYLDLEDMSAKIMAFIDSKTLRQEVGERLQQMAIEVFDMESYASRLEEIGVISGRRIVQEREDASEIASSGLARMDYYQSQLMRNNLKSSDEALRYYVRSWASGISRRKLFPGFHPGIFMEQNGIRPGEGDPLAAYLRAGKPEGPWCYQVLTSEETKTTIPLRIRVALHIHVYYPDLLPNMLARLSRNLVRPDLFISVATEQARIQVEKALFSYSGKVSEIKVVPNRGRDIAPFLTVFGNQFIDNYDVVGHLHTKKTESLQDSQIGEEWRIFLLENLLGGKANMADLILGRMSDDPSVGMVFPDDPNIIGWSKNRHFAEQLGRELGLGPFPENFLFPIGTMFWARVQALASLFERNLDWQDYPDEPLPYDGTLLHAMERLLPFVASKQGFHLVLTNVKEITR